MVSDYWSLCPGVRIAEVIMSCGHCLKDNLKEVERIADEPCTCTEEQQVGSDSSVCRSCEASGIINEIAEELSYRLESIGERNDSKKNSC